METTSHGILIEASWKHALEKEIKAEYFEQLRAFLKSEKETGQRIYPSGSRIFAAFNALPFHEVKVVILGQDPYHGQGQANGLSFSVNHGVRHPPSLQNIFKELTSDLGLPMPVTGNLECWARQGVLLLNAILTVRAGSPGSHQNKGWEQFTDGVIRALSEKREGLIFMLWGKFAQSKEMLIDTSRHYVLKAAHPSPYSASSGFFGCRHFSQANNILVRNGKKPVNWCVE